MSTENTALETAKAPVADGLPENVRAEMPVVQKDYGAGEFWKDEAPAETKPAEKPAEKQDGPKDEEKPAAKPFGTDLASKWGNKPKVKAPAADVPPGAKKEEPAKTEPAAQEGPDIEKMELDRNSSEKARSNFKVLKDITRQERAEKLNAQRELSELRTKLDSQVKTPVNSEETESLKKQVKELSDRLLLVDTKNSPVFQSQYVKPKNEALVAASELLKANGKEGDLAALIGKPRGELGKAIQELVKDMPPLDAHEATAEIHKAWKLNQAEQAALQNAGQINGAIKEQNANEHFTAFDKTWDKITNGLGELPGIEEIPKDADAEARSVIESYNADLKALRDNARRTATGPATYETISEAAAQAEMFKFQQKHVIPILGRQIATMQETMRGLEAEVKSYRSRNPNREISATPQAEHTTSSRNPTFEEAAATAWGGR